MEGVDSNSNSMVTYTQIIKVECPSCRYTQQLDTNNMNIGDRVEAPCSDCDQKYLKVIEISKQ